MSKDIKNTNIIEYIKTIKKIKEETKFLQFDDPINLGLEINLINKKILEISEVLIHFFENNNSIK